ncbi:MAG: aspartyl protease family protein [Pseudomonadota bacterium]|nr:aspartyl protease family protein [Pseudomonadota bacterium]
MLLLFAQLALWNPALAAPSYPPPRAELVLGGGVSSTTLDLWRSSPGADKIYVLVRLPDGSDALFLLDTGASISVIHREVVERLGLPIVPVDGRIEGLSGSVAWKRAVLPRIGLGDFQLNAVDVAVDVPGVPEFAGALPIAGILGNNVWTNFTCVVDYPADILELFVPGALAVPKRAAPLVVNGQHAYTPVLVRAEDGTRATVILEVDTGANDVLFSGATGEPFRTASTEGVEPVLGIGADLDDLPLASFLQVTRRVPLTKVRIGGRTIKHAGPARWYGADTAPVNRPDMPGLLGYGPMAALTAVLDFPGQHFLLRPSRRVPRVFDAYGEYLKLEQATHPNDPARAAIRGRLQYAKGDAAGALATVLEARKVLPDDAELGVLLSWFQRNAAEWDASNATLDALDPLALAEEGEWVAYIDSLLVDGQTARALDEATQALTVAAPDAEGRDDMLVALSDALLAAGKASQAGAAIGEAAAISPGGSAHLIRKARVALAEGDRYGAMVATRELIGVYPLNGVPLWLQATLTVPEDVPTLVADIEGALARLHPGDEPWDFVGAAYLAVGHEQEGREALKKGYARDCEPFPEGPDRANCDAWYWALGGERLDEAKARIELALTDRAWSSAYHDTAAAVAFAGGRGDDARRHAQTAARLSPGDPYLLWQLDRVDAKFPLPPDAP